MISACRDNLYFFSFCYTAQSGGCHCSNLATDRKIKRGKMKRRHWPGWTEWNDLQGVLNSKYAPAEPGCYMLAADRALSRAVGCDEEGILYIGSTSHILKRLRAFSSSAAAPNVTGHIAGWRYSAYLMHKHFPLESISVCWRITDQSATRQTESSLLAEYVRQHMEMPPLNYSLPRSIVL